MHIIPVIHALVYIGPFASSASFLLLYMTRRRFGSLRRIEAECKVRNHLFLRARPITLPIDATVPFPRYASFLRIITGNRALITRFYIAAASHCPFRPHLSWLLINFPDYPTAFLTLASFMSRALAVPQRSHSAPFASVPTLAPFRHRSSYSFDANHVEQQGLIQRVAARIVG